MNGNLCRFLGVAIVVASLSAHAQYQLNLLWNLDPGSRSYLTATDNNQRGMAYNPVTDHVYVVNRTGGLSVNVVDAVTGANVGTLSTAGISVGTFTLNHIGVAADGAIYGANLVSPSSATTVYKIYRWANEAAAPTVAYSGTVTATTGLRWGDNFDVRGSGNSTQILIGQGTSGTGARTAVFTTGDSGLTLTPTVFTYAAGTDFTLGDTRGGVAFGQGDTFYFRNAQSGSPTRYANFNLGSGSSTILSSTVMPGTGLVYSSLGSSPADNWLAALQPQTGASPTAQQQVYLFDISNPLAPAYVANAGFINPGNQNLNASGAIDIFGNRLFALDTNNGLRAWEIALIPEPASLALLGLGLLALALRRSHN